jgi:hypothetical protein
VLGEEAAAERAAIQAEFDRLVADVNFLGEGTATSANDQEKKEQEEEEVSDGDEPDYEGLVKIAATRSVAESGSSANSSQTLKRGVRRKSKPVSKRKKRRIIKPSSSEEEEMPIEFKPMPKRKSKS